MQQIEQNDRIMILQTNYSTNTWVFVTTTLIISDITTDDSGEYICRIYDRFFQFISSKDTAILLVTGMYMYITNFF